MLFRSRIICRMRIKTVMMDPILSATGKNIKAVQLKMQKVMLSE